MKIIGLSAGRERSAALADDGTAWCWGGIKRLGATLPPGYPADLCTTNATEIGHNRYAQPIPQALNPAVPFTAIADGYVDTLGVKRSGAVLSCRPVVAPDRGALRSLVAGMPQSAVQVALTQSCAFALHANGAVWSWGMNANGQLGRVTPSGLQSPAGVAGLPLVAALAAGQGHVLALDRSGRVWAWGANAAGQLGTGTLTAGLAPVKVPLSARIKRIAAGDTHSFALDENGRLWGWGSNNFGQVGNPAEKYFVRPVRIDVDFAIAQVDAGMFYTAATSVQGDVFAWGWNGMGQIGREDIAFSARPVRVRDLANVEQLAAGEGHVLAANARGVFAWGNNRSSACGAFPSVAVQVKPNRIALV
jgi:alpha-tubulin suppressor-like RCC1 family protein